MCLRAEYFQYVYNFYLALDTIFHFIFGGKSYAIFALLFGLTFFIQNDNQENNENHRIPNENHETYENHRIPYKNYENHENLIIQLKKYENHENPRIPYEKTENHENSRIQ